MSNQIRSLIFHIYFSDAILFISKKSRLHLSAYLEQSTENGETNILSPFSSLRQRWQYAYYSPRRQIWCSHLLFLNNLNQISNPQNGLRDQGLLLTNMSTRSTRSKGAIVRLRSSLMPEPLMYGTMTSVRHFLKSKARFRVFVVSRTGRDLLMSLYPMETFLLVFTNSWVSPFACFWVAFPQLQELQQL